MPFNDLEMAPLRNLDEFILGESRWIFFLVNDQLIFPLSDGFYFGSISEQKCLIEQI